MQRNAHTELQSTRRHLLQIYDAISNFRPLAERPPIIDSSLDVGSMNDLAEETSNQWLQPEGVPGLKKLKECIKLDLEGLEKVCPWVLVHPERLLLFIPLISSL